MIRKAMQQDVSRIAEILIFTKRTEYRKIFNNDKVSFGEMQVLPLALKLNNNFNLLNSYYVYDDEFVKGIMRITVYEKILEINELYVDSFFKGQGVGSSFIEFTKGFNVKTINLWVLEKNIAARGFYESHGFVNTGDRKLEDNTTEYIIKYCNKNKRL